MIICSKEQQIKATNSKWEVQLKESNSKEPSNSWPSSLTYVVHQNLAHHDIFLLLKAMQSVQPSFAWWRSEVHCKKLILSMLMFNRLETNNIIPIQQYI